MDKELLRYFYPHQACLTRAPKGSTKHGKAQPVPATARTYQMLKTNNTMKKLHQLWGKQPTSNPMAGSNSNVTVLTLNVNGLNDTDWKTG